MKRHYLIFKYFAKRGGIRFALINLAFKFHIISENFYRSSDFFNKKINNYFLNLKKEDWQKELEEQISIFYTSYKNLNIDNPKTFSEKIQWLKIHDSSTIKTDLADKYKVRAWVEKTIGKKYLIPLVGGPWEKADEIDFDRLPNQFALKANHGSGMNLIIKNKSELTNKDIKHIKKVANCWMKRLFGWDGMEAHYFPTERRIIAEEYIEQDNGDLIDYKVFCFNGNPEYIQIIGDRDLINHSGKQALYDKDWNRMPFDDEGYEEYEYNLPKPDCFEELMHVSKKLSKNFIFVRVDLYYVKGEIKFGEMTFIPAKGLSPWKPEGSDLIVGDKMKLHNMN